MVFASYKRFMLGRPSVIRKQYFLQVIILCLVLGCAISISSPAHANFLGLFPATQVEGLCAASNTSFVAVLDEKQQYHVFVIPAGFIPPQGLNVGRHIRVNYKKRSDGALVVKSIRVELNKS